ncbi:MAG TPA: FtsQ-type POTRA domain-containing protein [Anaerolineae bacterium]|nr:FtsQ-type POTRA domain-containing protein [Anaerolineae bacterium]
MPLRTDPKTRRRSASQQDFLSKPAKRRQPPARRQHRQEAALPQGVQAKGQRAARRLPRLSGLRLAAATLALGLMAMLGYLFSDAGFYVQTAAMRGQQITAAEALYRQAAIDGYSIFWVNPSAVAQRLEALPYVRRAVVTTALPNQVWIEIEERQPLAVWKVNGQEFWVDREGGTMPVLPADAAAAAGLAALPVLWDLDGSTVLDGNRLDPELIASVRQVHQKAPEVTEFGYDRIKGLQFRFAGGVYVSLGKPEGMAQRVASLMALHQSLASQGQMPVEIDWRNQDGYYLRMP